MILALISEAQTAGARLEPEYRTASASCCSFEADADSRFTSVA
jgi:hypothetical protein